MNPKVRTIILLMFSLVLLPGCADPNGDISGKFYAPRVERELDHFVATYSLYPTNHFFVGAFNLVGTNLDEGLVYWQEDQILLLYDELDSDAAYDGQCWRNRQWKLGRDTVKTRDEINGSDYLITDDNWRDWTNQCMTRGRQYVVAGDDARHMFPNVQVVTNSTGL